MKQPFHLSFRLSNTRRWWESSCNVCSDDFMASWPNCEGGTRTRPFRQTSEWARRILGCRPKYWCLNRYSEKESSLGSIYFAEMELLKRHRERSKVFFELLQLQPPCRGSCTSRISWGVLKASPKSCAVVSKDTKETPNLRYGRTWMDTLMPLKFRYWWYNLLAWMNQTCTCCMPCWQGVLSNSRDKVQGLFKGIRTTYGICTLTRNPSKEGSYVRPSTQDVL